jgi:uncharacterized membrane protein YgcG
MIPTRLLRLGLAAALLAAAAAPAAAQRQLHWRELAVQARLESDGTLAVSETHAMVFSGDWNGGERSFRVRLGQRLTLDGIHRRDPASDAWLPLQRGSLDAIDRWDWSGRSTVRWRSRLPSDPPFDAAEIVYRLDYRLSGILHRERDGWLLDHDFAFSDRAGNIERFVLDLELAPEWQAEGGLPSHLVEGPLFPGEGRVVSARLRYAGAGAPANATPPRPAPTEMWLVVALSGLGVAGLFGWAFARERAIGRLRPPPSLDLVDRAWLEQRVFALAPEEVGAAWDETIGSAEVAAMLARMQLEGKLASRVEQQGFLFLRKPNLHLTLLTDRAQLPQAERQLVGGLFPSGNETDTASLRKHYARSGFEPAAKIASTLKAGLGRRGFATQRPHPPRAPSAALVLLGLGTLAASALLSPSSWPALLALAIALLVLWIPAFAAAIALRPRVVGWRAPFAVVAVSEIAGLAALALLASLPGQSSLALPGGALLLLGLARTVATALQSRQGAETIARRLELAAARRWFEAELARPQPHLEDGWAPYLIAFGLAPQMDRWWRSFGGASAAIGSRDGGWGGSASSGGGATWSGGGGSFGGAGATASWAMAATSMSAGVAAASSSGGGGGGGGSSGGGGGGGW